MILAATVRQFRIKVEMALRAYRTMDAAAFDDFFRTIAEIKKSLDATVRDFAKQLDTARAEISGR